MELIIVVVIVAIVSVTAYAAFSGDTEYRLDVTARKIASDIRYAQQLAMDNHGSYRISFSTLDDSYTIYEKDSTSTPAKNPFTRFNFVVELDQGVYLGVTLDAVSFNESTYFQFDREGVPSSTGSVTLACGKMTKKIEVLETGLVVISSVMTIVEKF